MAVVREIRLFPNAVSKAKTLMSEALTPGDVCLDATCGNGHDTVFLARCVGEKGKVYAFDVQRQAIVKTRTRLIEEDLLERVRLVHAGHQDLLKFVTEGISGAMFNLGYLPGSNKKLITKPNTTVAALEAVTKILRPSGLITVVLYTGHAGGGEEAEQVLSWAVALPRETWDVAKLTFPNRANFPPYLLAVQRRGDAG